MGAWFCEGEGCPAVIPGPHPVEQGEEGWDPQEPMLCAGCGSEAAFAEVERLVRERENNLRKLDMPPSHFEEALFAAIREARRKIDRVSGFVGSS